MTAADIEARASAGDVRAQVDLAGRLDAEGRHADAIDWLARAGQAGDAQALTLLGVKLLTGHNAPFLPTDGARLLGDAATAGSAAAAAHLAVLIGGGFFVKQSWSVALDWLQRSAELGSAASQAQLRILAADDAKGGAAEPAVWARLRQGVDLDAWITAPAAKPISESPLVQTVQALVPPAARAWVIEQSQPRLVRAELYDPDTGRPALSEETRLNRIANFTLVDTNLLNLLIQARIAAALGIAFNHLEAFAVLHYAPGEEYGEHVDYLDPAKPAYAAEIARMGQRVATCLVYLNDGYEGGETEFPLFGVRHKGEAGDALVFVNADAAGVPDTRTVHAGRPPTSGEKWLLSQFIRNRPVVGATSTTRAS